MLCTFYRTATTMDRVMAATFREGLSTLGHTLIESKLEKYEQPLDKPTLAGILFGIQDRTPECMRDHRMLQVPFVYIDKGYVRQRDVVGDAKFLAQYRVSYNSFQPLDYFQKIPRSKDRWKKLRVKVYPRRTVGENILIAGSSLRYADFHGFKAGNDGSDPATNWAMKLVRRLRAVSDRPIVYRPKPTWKEAVPIKNTIFSGPDKTIEEELHKAHVLVTFGSNASIDALRLGVPVLCVGDSIAKPLSSTLPEEVDTPFWPDDDVRQQFFCDIAYCQYTLDEFRDGTAWNYVLNL